MEEKKESKGLWKLIQEQGKVVYWPPDPPMTIDDIQKAFQNMWDEDIARRERMDKEYTDISKIKISELDEIIAKYDGNPPNGLMVKVKMAGQYSSIPIRVLHQYMTIAGNYARELYEKQEQNAKENRDIEERQ